MTYRDDPSHSPESAQSSQAMVGGPQHPSDALVPHTNGVALSASYVGGPTGPTQDVLHGGMDANEFFNSLRRRWILALGMGLVAAVVAAVALWILFPESSSAVALFQVSSEAPKLVFDNANETTKFDVLQNTQLALLKSDFVLSAAIRSPAVSSLSILAAESEPVKWLTDNLQVDFPNRSEILRISLSGDGLPEDLRQLVDAVADAYLNEVVYKERQRRLTARDALANALKTITDELTRKMEEYHDVAVEIGASEAYDRDAETELLLRDIADLQLQKSRLHSEMMKMRTDFLVTQQQLKSPQIVDAQVEEALAADPNMNMLQQQLMAAQYEMSQKAAVLKRGRSLVTDSLEQRIRLLNQQVAQYRAQAKAQMAQQQKDSPDTTLRQLTKEFQLRYAMMNSQMGEFDKSLEEKMRVLRTKVEKSVDLVTRQSELDQLQAIAKDMTIRLESLDIETRGAPDRVRSIQPAVVTPGINLVQRYAIAGLGGVSAFSLVCVAIGYMEFRNRRLSGPSQIDDGLRIRVVGTLPSLSARKLLDPNHPLIAQLTDSIDSVRTLLMHDATAKRRQVVLITSAATMEGRTTVASQLAASLARAGRRTLLVDGDLRRPALHSLFDAPLEDGLCEVLRGEADVADVIRPTHAEGLWLLTAGYCDVDAIHALATEQMQPVFDKLRTEYDFIIIDGAPIIGLSDALIFGQYSDGAVISVRRDFSQMPKIHQATALLHDVGIRVIGAVVNGVPTKADDRVTQLRLVALKSDRLLQTA
jgi:succinoglycan biosynthesis transport protein ExoP